MSEPVVFNVPEDTVPCFILKSSQGEVKVDPFDVLSASASELDFNAQMRAVQRMIQKNHGIIIPVDTAMMLAETANNLYEARKKNCMTTPESPESDSTPTDSPPSTEG